MADPQHTAQEAPPPLELARAGALPLEALIDAAQATSAAGDESAAIALYRTWLDHAPADTPMRFAARFNLAVTLARMGDSAGAEREYGLVLNENPDFAPARQNLALLLAQAGRAQEARLHPVAAPLAVHLYHIAYNAQTRDSMPAGYALLDNLDSPKNDWREYWPMRNFLLNMPLDEEAFYGFLSPRFTEKTGLPAARVRAIVEAHAYEADVFTFSPQPDMGALFLNVFEQEETFTPGFIDACEAFLAAVGRPMALRPLVMDSRQIVFSNYIVARPAFWRAWLAINEQLFAICEGPASPLQQALTADTGYPGNVQRKVFLMERLATLLLTVEPHWRVHAYDTFACAWSGTPLAKFRMEAILSDALKIAMREQGFPEYRQAFAALRDKLR